MTCWDRSSDLLGPRASRPQMSAKHEKLAAKPIRQQSSSTSSSTRHAPPDKSAPVNVRYRIDAGYIISIYSTQMLQCGSGGDFVSTLSPHPTRDHFRETRSVMDAPWGVLRLTENAFLLSTAFPSPKEILKVREATVGIKSRTPTEILGWGPRPG